MKKLILTILIGSSLLFSSGCASFKGQDPKQELAFWANVAATVGTQEALVAHPEYKPAFEQALAALDALVTANSVDIVAFRNVLNSLPVKELKSKEARIAINIATIAFSRYGQNVGLDQENYVAIALRAVRDGIRSGLGVSK